MNTKKTLVIGASNNPERYSNLAIKQLLLHKHTVVALGKKQGHINGVTIQTIHQAFSNIDTITLYVNPMHQKGYYNYILSLKPRRIIFNPGTENDELMQLAAQNDIATLEACTLVLLSTGQY
jgi:uncharacterized protein